MAYSQQKYDAIVVGSGPNGLSAAIRLAQTGKRVKIFEAKSTIGGGTRTAELTLPGFKHDICSAVHPTAAGSPFFKSLPLEKYGLKWLFPEIQVSHPMDSGSAVNMSGNIIVDAQQFGADEKAFLNLLSPFSRKWNNITEDLFNPISIPQNPVSMARFGWYGLRSAKQLAHSLFKNEITKTYFAGMAAHSIIPLDKLGTAAFGMVLGSSIHGIGWPVAKGGSVQISNALAKYFLELGGEIEVDAEIRSFSQLPPHRVLMLDITPKQFLEMAGDELPSSYKKKLSGYQYGPGVFKIDYALNEPVPWINKGTRKAGTIHIGAGFEEIERSERQVWNGIIPEKPYLLISQPTIVDPDRAPKGKHILWVYSHVPNGSTHDMTEIIEANIERFAPGFRDIIAHKSIMNTHDFEQYNPNYIGGDINGGAQIITQLFSRPVLRLSPYSTPVRGVYLCSSSTPPGGGVHGMCGFNAANKALSDIF